MFMFRKLRGKKEKQLFITVFGQRKEIPKTERVPVAK
jgi:hypothetical protein